MNTLVTSESPGERALEFSTATPARRRAWVVLLGLSAVFVVAALWQPSDHSGVILCPFRALTGHPCPGCGMTRAFCAIAHGEWRRAVGYHPLSPLLFLAALTAWAGAAATILNLRGVRARLARLRPPGFIAKLMLVLVMVWWVARLAGGF